MRVQRMRMAIVAAALLASLPSLRAEDPGGGLYELAQEVVCRVNTEAINKGQVEERMDTIMAKLAPWRKAVEAAGQWNAAAQKQYDDMYIPSFRDSLRMVVRERLMLQHAKEDPRVKIDDRQYEKYLKQALDHYRSQGLLGAKGRTVAEVEKQVREGMLVDRFRWLHFGGEPSKPEVRRYYEENIARHQRPAGVKVRIIRVNRIVTNKFTGEKTRRKDAWEFAQELRKEVVAYAGSFAEVAKANSDDDETKARGGLFLLENDPYFNPEGYSAALATAIRGLKEGEVSEVFELSDKSYAFVLLEGRREAGPAPLEGALYEELSRMLQRQKTRKQEDEWFRKALKNALVVHVVNAGWETLPADFFFTEESDGQKKEESKSAPPKAEPKGKG